MQITVICKNTLIMLQIKHLLKPFFFTLLSFSCLFSYAQENKSSIISTLRLEARAEFEYHHDSLMGSGETFGNSQYGFYGKYFNLHMGGTISPKLSYYYRQRIVANPGKTSFFDNTDFLYLDYKISDRWTLRGGKDAMAVGGFEYDHPPIDVLYNSYYWGVFYCFQIGASATYRSEDGNQSVILQVTNSPYVYSGSPFSENSLLSYNILWSGKFNHFRTIYSFNMMERDRGYFMSYLALGNKLVFDKWDFYLDLIHHGITTDQLTKSWSIISCANIYINNDFNLFVKGGYEQNLDKNEIAHYQQTGELWDCLARPGQQYGFYGIGFEFRPDIGHDMRIHAYVADFVSRQNALDASDNLHASDACHHINVNVGLTWNMDILKYIRRHYKLADINN